MDTMLPLPNERLYAPYKIGAIVRVLEEQGIAPEVSLKGSGVTIDDLGNAFARTSVSQYLIVCENAMALSRTPSIAFEVGARLHLSAYGIYGYALMSCTSLREYFRLAVKYRRLTTPSVAIEFVEKPDAVSCRFPDIFVANPPPRLRQFLIEQQASVTVTHVQEAAGGRCPPLEARFSYSAPAHADIYPTYLGCPCYFDQPECELVYDNTMLDRTPQMAHTLTSVLVQEMCDKLLGQAMEGNGLSRNVYRVLMSKPGEFPSSDEVARMLNMTGRTLRRRLQDEGTSFQAIVDDVRCSLAREYLKDTRMNTSDIAMLLGFSDGANFRRALKRWTGKTVNDLRR
ncbi:AraC family transcriptional regulator [Burkholderia multivorans]|uniref:AraC family transcriptional regulator n=1 Tax=Burkholderia multivorans TaxID=87883 RepID=UPI001C22ED40|nr:AraC family transcriptional regulator [Burkholderia multivorans]MBU9456347.1 AraC family transcriptional regulator [Burkholderia multivorans]